MATNRCFAVPSLAFLLVTAVGCNQSAPLPSTSASRLAGEWTLVELNGQPAATGAGGRPATLYFDAYSPRVGGFAGCNRFTASSTSAGDSLRIGPTALTRMACRDGMELEGAFATALGATTRFQVTGTELTLFGPAGPLARFTRETP